MGMMSAMHAELEAEGFYANDGPGMDWQPDTAYLQNMTVQELREMAEDAELDEQARREEYRLGLAERQQSAIDGMMDEASRLLSADDAYEQWRGRLAEMSDEDIERLAAYHENRDAFPGAV